MRTYKIYVESGPQRKTTLVHVIDLLGCVANGKTTDAAIEETPEAIRAYLAYLKRHGEESAISATVRHMRSTRPISSHSPRAISARSCAGWSGRAPI